MTNSNAADIMNIDSYNEQLFIKQGISLIDLMKNRPKTESALKRGAGSYRQRLKQEMREQILRSAEQVFAEKGFAASKIEEIAGRAGVAVGTIYLHFGSKDDLYFTLLNTRIDYLFSVRDKSVSGPMSALEKIRRLTETELELNEENQLFFKIFIQETSGFEQGIEYNLGSKIMERYRGHIEFLSEIFKRGMADGEFADHLDPLNLAVALQGMINAFMAHWDHRGTPGDSSEKAALIVEIFFGNCLRGDSA